MFGRKTRKAQAVTTATATEWDRMSTMYAGADEMPHTVTFTTDAVTGSTTYGTYRTRYEAEQCARNFLASFPNGLTAVYLTR